MRFTLIYFVYGELQISTITLSETLDPIYKQGLAFVMSKSGSNCLFSDQMGKNGDKFKNFQCKKFL